MRVCDRDGSSTYRYLRNMTDDSDYDLCADCFQEFLDWLGGETEARPESIVDLLAQSREQIRQLNEQVQELRNRKPEEVKTGLLKRIFSR